MKRLRENDTVDPSSKRQRVDDEPDSIGADNTDPMVDPMVDPLAQPMVTPPAQQLPRWVAPTNDSERRAQRTTGLEGYGVGNALGGPDPSTGPKRRRLVAARSKGPSPVSGIGHVGPGSLVNKVDPSNAGDHSPSISALNRTKDKAVGITGRGASGGDFGVSHKERDVPTLQFNTKPFTDQPSQERRSDLGAAAHTAFTSLREMHGVGEQDVHATRDGILDQTAQAYSPYSSSGDYNPGGVDLPRVNVHAESSTGPKLHKSEDGVSPLVAQQQINLWYRDPDFVNNMAARRDQKRPDEDMS
jgi:hypothetical protein